MAKIIFPKFETHVLLIVCQLGSTPLVKQTLLKHIGLLARLHEVCDYDLKMLQKKGIVTFSRHHSQVLIYNSQVIG